MTIIESCIWNAAELRMFADRPFITLSYTQSLDGCIAAHPDEPFEMAGSESQRLPDVLKARHDAMIPGIRAVLASNSRVGKLTGGEVRPLPVILDSRLRVSPSGDMLNGAGRRAGEHMTDFGAGSRIRGKLSHRRGRIAYSDQLPSVAPHEPHGPHYRLRFHRRSLRRDRPQSVGSPILGAYPRNRTRPVRQRPDRMETARMNACHLT